MGLTVKDFLYDTINTCNKLDVTFKLTNKENLEFSSGSFDGESKELNSIIGRDDWLELLVHESCHMDQWSESSPIWTDPFVQFDIFNAENLKWADKNTILNAFHAWTHLEIDCDERSVEKIKKYNLDIDIPTYIQKSNCYHQSYYYFHKYEIFYDIENVPYSDDDLVSIFNDEKILDLEEIWCENPILEKFLVQHNVKLEDY